MKTFNIKRGQQSGFTLIELVMVIVILGVLAAMALPQYTGLKTEAEGKTASYEAAANTTKNFVSSNLGSSFVQ